MKIFKTDYEQGYHDQLMYHEARYSQRNQQRLRAMLARRPAGRLLEIGCGAGGLLRLARQYYDIQGIEISATALRAIQGEFGSRVRLGNLEQDALPAPPYDVIAAFNILEHLEQPLAAVRKLYDGLNPGGLLIGSVPNNGGAVGKVVTCIGNFFDRTHRSTLSPQGWERIFRACGFRQVEPFGEITIGRNRCHYLKAPAWRLLAFNLMFACWK